MKEQIEYKAFIYVTVLHNKAQKTKQNEMARKIKDILQGPTFLVGQAHQTCTVFEHTKNTEYRVKFAKRKALFNCELAQIQNSFYI